MENNRQNRTVTEYSLFRALGTFFVVFGHAAAMNYLPSAADFSAGEVGYTGEAGRIITQAAAYLYTFHMPLFFALSGAVMRVTRADERPFDELFASRFKRLMLPYFGFLFLWSLPIKTLCGIFTPEKAAQVVMNSALTTGESGYLWFLYKLFVVTMLFWVFARLALAKNRRLGLIALGVAALLGLGVPVTLFIGVEMKYFVFFALGWLFEEIRPRFAAWVRARRAATLAAFAAYLALFYYLNLAATPAVSHENLYLIQTFERAYGILSPAVSILAWFAVCCLFVPKEGGACERALNYLNSRSVGVYFVHDPFNYIVDALYLSLAAAGAVGISGGMTVAVFVLKLVLGIGGSLLLWALWRRLSARKAVRAAAVALCALVYIASVAYIYTQNVY